MVPRQRKRRPGSRRRLIRRKGWIRTARLWAAGAAGVVLVVGLVLILREDVGAAGVVAQDPALERQVRAVCEQSLGHVDCDCFWTRAAPKLNDANLPAVLAALHEREHWGGQITTLRLRKTVGEETARAVNAALYKCTDF